MRDGSRNQLCTARRLGYRSRNITREGHQGTKDVLPCYVSNTRHLISNGNTENEFSRSSFVALRGLPADCGFERVMANRRYSRLFRLSQGVCYRNLASLLVQGVLRLPLKVRKTTGSHGGKKRGRTSRRPPNHLNGVGR